MTTTTLNHAAVSAHVVTAAEGTPQRAGQVLEARVLLDMLGLIDGPAGRQILPDETRTLPMPDTNTAVTPTDPSSPRAHAVPDELRSRAHLPAGLRELPVATVQKRTTTTKARRTSPEETTVPAQLAPPSTAVHLDDPAATGQGPYVAALRTDELFVDRDYQRPLDPARANRMATNWDPRLLGILDVSDRGPGQSPRYAVVAGQHRWAAATRARVSHLACTVHEGLDVAGEAQLMHQLDRSMKKLSGHDQWRARRGAGDTQVLAVEACAAEHGLTVGPALADTVLRSYGAAEKLVEIGGPGLLTNTLSVLFGAYGHTAAAWQAPLVTGVGQLLHRHPDVDIERLTRVLASSRPEQIRASASALREAENGTLAELMTRVITGQYNRSAGPRLTGGRS